MSLMMRGEPGLIAADSSKQRVERMDQNLSRLHINEVQTELVDWTDPEALEQDRELFDAILLDVPCSNSGVIRRRVDVRWRIQPGDFERQAKLQSKLLENVSQLLKPNGRIVYSTCSIDRVENEEVVEASGLTVESTSVSHPWEHGFDGAFAALLRK